jgi:formimidoylglutamate deiminase
VVGLCPITEANLGDGIFPAVDYQQAGGRFGVGTDSNVLISVAEELRTLEYGQRLRDRRRNRMAAAGQSIGSTLFGAALRGGRQAAGIAEDAHDGHIVLRSDAVEFAGRSRDGILDSWIFAASRPVVGEVWAGGRRIVDGGRHVMRGAAEVRFAAVMVRLGAEM